MLAAASSAATARVVAPRASSRRASSSVARVAVASSTRRAVSRGGGGLTLSHTTTTATRTRAGEGEGEGAKTADDVEDIPPWERREIEKKAAMEKGGLPWPAYLGLAAIVSHRLRRVVLRAGVRQPHLRRRRARTAFAYKPILFWFIGTGFPLAAWSVRRRASRAPTRRRSCRTSSTGTDGGTDDAREETGRIFYRTAKRLLPLLLPLLPLLLPLLPLLLLLLLLPHLLITHPLTPRPKIPARRPRPPRAKTRPRTPRT